MSKALKVVEDASVAAPVSEKVAIRSVVERIATDPNISIERVEQAFAFWRLIAAEQARAARQEEQAQAVIRGPAHWYEG